MFTITETRAASFAGSSPGCDWLWLVDETAGEVQR